MAGIGRPPKDPATRRNRTPPSRGEWVDLPRVTVPVLPELPKRPRGAGRWSSRTVAVWDAWRRDPATTQYGPAEIASAVELAWLHDANVKGDRDAKAAEVRLRTDGLGLTAKGKRDLRWRAPTEHAADPAVKVEQSKGAAVRILRAV